jgi:hypothetical protein
MDQRANTQVTLALLTFHGASAAAWPVDIERFFQIFQDMFAEVLVFASSSVSKF